MIQKEGLAMGAPNSGLIAEFFLQNIENIHLAHLTEKHKIAGYFRYVDDILLIYDPDYTNIQDITNDFNPLHPNLKFTTELETNNKLNYLDITTHRTPTGWQISIYRKPTFTDSIIPYSSNQPAQQKYALQQATHIQPAWSRVQNRRKHHPQHHVQQHIPNPQKNQTPPTKNHHPQQTENHIYTEMGHVHLHRQRVHLYHQLVQKHRSENSNAYQ